MSQPLLVFSPPPTLQDSLDINLTGVKYLHFFTYMLSLIDPLHHGIRSGSLFSSAFPSPFFLLGGLRKDFPSSRTFSLPLPCPAESLGNFTDCPVLPLPFFLWSRPATFTRLLFHPHPRLTKRRSVHFTSALHYSLPPLCFSLLPHRRDWVAFRFDGGF